jgi:DNA-binding winged helix-turn-helix (wHTH) protein
VLILTARDTSADKVAGLDAGADDYLVKPFDLAELQARLRALIRRAAGAAAHPECAGVVLDPAASGSRLEHGQAVTLSAREYALLHDLLSHKNRIRTRAELEESLYAWGEETESNTVEVYIHHLRKKLGADFIRTVRGLGYRVGVTIAALLTWIGAALLGYRQARHDLQELMDGQIAMSASLLLAEALQCHARDSVIAASPVKLRGIKDKHNVLSIEFQIRTADGVTLLRSANADVPAALRPARIP